MRIVADLGTIIVAGSVILGLLLRWRNSRRSSPPEPEPEQFIEKYKDLYSQGYIDQDHLDKMIERELKKK